MFLEDSSRIRKENYKLGEKYLFSVYLVWYLCLEYINNFKV